MSGCLAEQYRVQSRRGFSLIELIAVMVVLAVLSAVAVPKYYDYSTRAREAAAEGSIGGMNTALHMAYVQHRVDNAPSGQWITSVSQIASVMQTGELPSGVTIDTGQIVDQEGNEFDLIAETETESARLELDTGGGGGGS